MEVIDSARVGDSYSPMSVARAGQEVLQTCFKKDLCGEIALEPTGTTTLAVCGSLRKNASEPLPVMPGPMIPGMSVRGGYSRNTLRQVQSSKT